MTVEWKNSSLLALFSFIPRFRLHVSSIVDLQHATRTLCNFCLLIHFICCCNFWLAWFVLISSFCKRDCCWWWWSLIETSLIDRRFDDVRLMLRRWLITPVVIKLVRILEETCSSTEKNGLQYVVWAVFICDLFHTNTHAHTNSIITSRKHHFQTALYCSSVWC